MIDLRRGETVLIVGPSGRAAAESVRRLGAIPQIIDLFADQDTRRLGDVIRCPIDRYPHGIVDLAATLPAIPFVYAGGLENHPDVIDRLAQRHRLLGNDRSPLDRVRNPRQLRNACQTLGGSFPRTILPGEPAEAGTWVQKPIRSAGGRGVTLRTTSAVESPPPGNLWQQYIPGESYSALFHGTQPLAMTLQLLGIPWLHTQGFTYAGSIGPIELPLFESILRIGSALAEWAGLVGPWGFDFVHDDQSWTLIEVNPRYTASMETWELATGRSAYAPGSGRVPTRRIVGKGIYFAPGRVVIPDPPPWDDPRHMLSHEPGMADLPDPGTIIEPGQPVLTLRTIGTSIDDCQARLQRLAHELDQLFGPSPGI